MGHGAWGLEHGVRREVGVVKKNKDMEIIKKFKAVILVLLVVIVLVILRTSGNHFKPDAGKWAAPSADGSNMITREQIIDLKGDLFIITLDKPESSSGLSDATNILPASLLESENLKKIRKNKGPVILYSEDPSVSAGTWMVLSQMGIKNLYILSESPDNEILRNEFQPDTISRPEI